MTLSTGAQVAIIIAVSFGWIPFVVFGLHAWRRHKQGTARQPSVEEGLSFPAANLALLGVKGQKVSAPGSRIGSKNPSSTGRKGSPLVHTSDSAMNATVNDRREALSWQPPKDLSIRWSFLLKRASILASFRKSTPVNDNNDAEILSDHIPPVPPMPVSASLASLITVKTSGRRETVSTVQSLCWPVPMVYGLPVDVNILPKALNSRFLEPTPGSTVAVEEHKESEDEKSIESVLNKSQTNYSRSSSSDFIYALGKWGMFYSSGGDTSTILPPSSFGHLATAKAPAGNNDFPPARSKTSADNTIISPDSQHYDKQSLHEEGSVEHVDMSMVEAAEPLPLLSSPSHNSCCTDDEPPVTTPDEKKSSAKATIEIVQEDPALSDLASSQPAVNNVAEAASGSLGQLSREDKSHDAGKREGKTAEYRTSIASIRDSIHKLKLMDRTRHLTLDKLDDEALVQIGMIMMNLKGHVDEEGQAAFIRKALQITIASEHVTPGIGEVRTGCDQHKSEPGSAGACTTLSAPGSKKQKRTIKKTKPSFPIQVDRSLSNFSYSATKRQDAKIRQATSHSKAALGEISNLQKPTLPNPKSLDAESVLIKPASVNSLRLSTHPTINTNSKNSLRRKPLPPFLVAPSQTEIDNILNHTHPAGGDSEIERMLSDILIGMGQAEVGLDGKEGELAESVGCLESFYQIERTEARRRKKAALSANQREEGA
ncbi:hypothetical protein IAR50_000310 [Cryptococcus sp. DSM 104548]